MDWTKYVNLKDYPKHTDKSEEAKKLKIEYQNEGQRLEELFKKDALEEVSLTNHPKAEKAFEIAWNGGYNSGFYDVFMELEKLAELLIK